MKWAPHFTVVCRVYYVYRYGKKFKKNLKKKLSLWPIWQTTQRQVVVAFLVDYIVLYLSIARSLETYYSVQRDLLQCQKRPTTVSKETYYSVKRDLLVCQWTCI